MFSHKITRLTSLRKKARKEFTVLHVQFINTYPATWIRSAIVPFFQKPFSSETGCIFQNYRYSFRCKLIYKNKERFTARYHVTTSYYGYLLSKARWKFGNQVLQLKSCCCHGNWHHFKCQFVVLPTYNPRVGPSTQYIQNTTSPECFNASLMRDL